MIGPAMTPPASIRAAQPSAAGHLAATRPQTAERSIISPSALALPAPRGNPGQTGEALAGGRRTQDLVSQLGVEASVEELAPPFPPQATFANQTHVARTPNAMWGPTDEGTQGLFVLAPEVTLGMLCAFA